MTTNIFNEHMLEVFLFETTELMEQMEEQLLSIEHSKNMTKENIDEIFRIMHTIKGSAAMMQFDGISILTHKFEDLFYYIRENPISNEYTYEITEIGFLVIDFLRIEVKKIEEGEQANGDSVDLKEKITLLLARIKGAPTTESNDNIIKNVEAVKTKTLDEDVKISKRKLYEAKVYFDTDCGMLNIRAFTVIRNLTDYCDSISYIPEELMDNEDATDIIEKNGFIIRLSTDFESEDIEKILKESLFVSNIKLSQLHDPIFEDKKDLDEQSSQEVKALDCQYGVAQKKSIISVNIEKMDKLMDLVGEIVITESMVINNPDLKGLQLDNFQKAAAQLKKLNNELQDVVMSIRMIPIAATFHKMHRIVRDMNIKMGKNVELFIYGEEAEVDKSIIDNLGDPLLHLVRNSMDHGIEDPKERKKAGKPEKGRITLDAQNNGSEVTIRISDDGKGLNSNIIYEKGKAQGLVTKFKEEMTDKEIFSLLFLAGFSTTIEVSEFSGRGVGLDVVRKTIEKLGGSLSVDSVLGEGTTITMRIPLTLAIINGMKVSVGKSIFTIPITSIKESMKIKDKDIVMDTADREMAMIRGKAYPVVRLHKHFDIPNVITELTEGILVMVETEDRAFCLFADTIIGEQQVVVKPIPSFIGKCQNTDTGISGCAILDDANISIIIDVNGLYTQVIK